MMRVWDAPFARPTKDIDLLGHVPDELDQLENTFKEICAQAVEPDGMVFRAETLRADRIREHVWLLARQRDFDGSTLLLAIAKTFQRRSTRVVNDPVSLSTSFATSENTRTLWSSFRRGGGASAAPESFQDVAAAITRFLRIVAVAASDGEPFEMTWKAPGPWQSG